MKKRNLQSLSFLCFFCFIFFTFFNFKVFAEEIPIKPENYVLDKANVIKNSSIDLINTNLKKLEYNTKAKAFVLIINSLDGQDIKIYAENVVNKWNLDGDYCLFLVAIKDRKSRLEISPTLNTAINSEEAQKLLSTSSNYFKASNYNAGILYLCKNIDIDITSCKKASSITNNNIPSNSKNNVNSNNNTATPIKGTATKKEPTTFELFLTLLFLVLCSYGIYKYIKKKIQLKEYKVSQNYQEKEFRSGRFSKKI